MTAFQRILINTERRNETVVTPSLAKPHELICTPNKSVGIFRKTFRFQPLSEVSLCDDTDGNKGLRFHRSVSMGTNGAPWSKSGLDGRIIMLRKRNNSSGEMGMGTDLFFV